MASPQDFGLRSLLATELDRVLPAQTRELAVPETPSTPIEIGAPPPLAKEAFHGILGEIVLANDPFTESDPAAVLIQGYVLLGNIVGRGPHCYADSTRHGVNENCLNIGNTGDGRKGTSLSNIKKFIVPADVTWSKERIQGGLSSGEGLVAAVRDPGAEDLGVRDKRLVVVETEFASTLKVMSRKGSTVSELIRQAFDSGQLNIMTRKNPLRCTSPHISIVGHCTPADLRRHLADTEIGNGFLNRFLIFYSRRSKFLPEDKPMPEEQFHFYTAAIADVVATAQTASLLPRDEAARKLWDQQYELLTTSHPGIYGALTARAAAHVCRLSMVAALLDKSGYVREAHLRAALAIWDYSCNSIRFVFGDNTGDRLTDSILAKLRNNPDGMNLKSISQALGNNESAVNIQRALATLKSIRLVRSEYIRIHAKGPIPETWFAIDPRRSA